MSKADSETIVARATAPGRGGIGIIRVSGPLSPVIAEAVVGKLPPPRQVQFSRFLDAAGQPIDEGIVLYFPAPHSYTGEDVLELQGHGSPVVLDQLQRRIADLGARPARPGEFTERAFLNGRMDLVQAESVADLIEAESSEGARSALRSLQGVFSEQVHTLVENITRLRVYVESALDFPDEEIDFLSEGNVSAHCQNITDKIVSIEKTAIQGQLLKEGMTVVLAGRPNVGKSSLLNALAGHDAAIVTDIPGTTRDPLFVHIHIDGMPLHVIDTAGLHDAPDPVEQEGIRRARKAIGQADRVLLLVDDSEASDHLDELIAECPGQAAATVVRNKIDVSGRTPGLSKRDGGVEVALSARTGSGVDDLRRHLEQVMGFRSSTEGLFMARRRHLQALAMAREAIERGQAALASGRSAELLAEDLSQAQRALGEITGQVTSDDLLGRIFSEFCIGK